MQRMKAFWNSGSVAKIATIGGVLILVGCICCSGLTALGTVLPTPAATQMPALSGGTKSTTPVMTATNMITMTSTSIETLNPTATPSPTTMPTAVVLSTNTPVPVATAVPPTDVPPPTAQPTQGNRVRIGASCVDGTSSDTTGGGACSRHGGVACWRYSDGSCTNP